jgi:hypothetical protein
MTIKLIWAFKIAPQDDEAKNSHEFGLSWYRFEDEIGYFEKSLQQSVRPAVWIKFSQIKQLERIQGAYPEAKLGPADSFTEALLFAENWEQGKALEKKVTLLLEMEKEVDEMEAILREDSMEDY